MIYHRMHVHTLISVYIKFPRFVYYIVICNTQAYPSICPSLLLWLLITPLQSIVALRLYCAVWCITPSPCHYRLAGSFEDIIYENDCGEFIWKQCLLLLFYVVQMKDQSIVFLMVEGIFSYVCLSSSGQKLMSISPRLLLDRETML